MSPTKINKVLMENKMKSRSIKYLLAADHNFLKIIYFYAKFFW